MRTSTRLLVGLAAAGAVAAGGSAFTASLSFDAGGDVPPDNVAGFGELDVTGATVATIKHNLSTNGQTIASSAITFSSNVKTTATVRAGFGTAEQAACAQASGVWTCSYGASAPITSTAMKFTVSVS